MLKVRRATNQTYVVVIGSTGNQADNSGPDPTQGIRGTADATGVTYPSSPVAPEKSQRDLLTLVTGALASLVLIGTSLTALNKNVIGFHAWPGTSSEPKPFAVLPAAEPEVSSTRATFGFNGPAGASSLAIVGLPGAGLPGFRPSPVTPGAGGPGLGARTTIGEAPVGPPAPDLPVTPLPTPTPAPVTDTPIASAATTAGPVPASVSAPGKTTNQAGDTPDRKAGKGRRKEKALGRPGTSAAPKATTAAAPVAQSTEATRASAPAIPAAPKGNGAANPQRGHERKGTVAPRRREPKGTAPAAAPAPAAGVAQPAPAPAAGPSPGPQAPGNGPHDPGGPDKGPKLGKGRGPA